MFSARRALTLGALVLILMSPAPRAFAQSEDSADYERMLELSDEATSEVLDGNFEAGAIKFRAAYRAFPDPVLLKNEMIAWYRAGDCRSALPPARNFLQSDEALPDDVADVRTVERDCHIQLTEEAFETGDLTLVDYHLRQLDPLELPAEAQERVDALRHQRHALAPAHPPVVETPQSAPAASPSPLAWGLFGGGAAGAITGLGLHIVALQRQSELRELSESTAPADGQFLLERRASWDGYQRTTRWLVPTLYTLSAAAIGTGLYFTFIHTPEPESAALRWTPSVAPGYAGAHIVGTF